MKISIVREFEVGDVFMFNSELQSTYHLPQFASVHALHHECAVVGLLASRIDTTELSGYLDACKVRYVGNVAGGFKE